jgi:hypothetical protein
LTKQKTYDIIKIQKAKEIKTMAYHDTVTNMMTANHKQAVEWSRLGHRIDLYKYREEYDDYVYVTNWTVEYE